MANYLVTGSTGQIGGFLCEELVADGHTVLCYDFRPNLENVSKVAGKVEIVPGDVTDMGELLSTLKRGSIDRVIHLAAMVLLDSMKRPAKAFQINVMGTNNILEAGRLMDIEKIVLVSSVSVYGKTKTRRRGVADEEDIPNPPIDPYSTSKLAVELMGKYYRETYGMDVNVLRITAAWELGRYWGYTGQFNDFVKKIAPGENATFPQDFAYKREKLRWLYVKDASHAFAHVAGLAKTKSCLYNTGSRRPFNARDVISAIKSVMPDSKIEIDYLDSPTNISATVAGPNGMDVDCSKLYEELGFDQRYTLEAAVLDMVNIERMRAGLPKIQIELNHRQRVNR